VSVRMSQEPVYMWLSGVVRGPRWWRGMCVE
jgi:hypothetical protein